ncbi:unnamed protein product, partial [Echinostoma caproni]|uniref:Adrenoleukodystrophy related protein n=1 Tax=Echinostoma caproni TaxID=27848 RepID=A0A183B5X1_9TREM
FTEQHPSVPCRIVFAGWRGIRSLRHYIGRHERCHLMRMANLEPKPMICGRTPTSNHDKEIDADGPDEPEEGDEAPGDDDFQCESLSTRSKQIND